MNMLTLIVRKCVWPIVYLGMAWGTQDKWVATLILFFLLFRRDVSKVLSQRRLTVEVLGFKGCLYGSSYRPK